MRTGEEAINRGLAKRLQQMSEERARAARAAAAEDEEFSAEFLSMARQVFQMIDKDNSGTLTKKEIVHSVSSDKSVKDFLQNCGEPNLQFLLVPARLEASLDALDTSKDGELDMDECTGAASCFLRRRRERGRVYTRLAVASMVSMRPSESPRASRERWRCRRRRRHDTCSFTHNSRTQGRRPSSAAWRSASRSSRTSRSAGPRPPPPRTRPSRPSSSARRGASSR